MNILRIATLNANGQLNHKQELIIFLNVNKIDILLVSEKHFTNQTVFKIPKYLTHNTPHSDGTAHGGSAVLIRKSIPHHELQKFQTDKI